MSLREDLVTVRFRRDGYEEATARLRDFLDDFERVAELGEKATPGEWWYGNRNGRTELNPSEWGMLGMWAKDNPAFIFGAGGGWDSSFEEPTEHDAAFIVAARNFVEKWGARHD